ncbi:MAG: DUF2155 domain-containing protein [Pseudomonadota bacterium]
MTGAVLLTLALLLSAGAAAAQGTIESEQLAPLIPGGQLPPSDTPGLLEDGEQGNGEIEEMPAPSQEFKRAPLGVIEPDSPVLVPPVDTVATPAAKIRQLDKLNGESETLTIRSGDRQMAGRLEILVEDCRQPTAASGHGDIAFLKIWDTRDPEAEPVFSGWMFADSPALSAMDHPRYDVWVMSCATEAGEAAGDSAQKSP